MVSTAHLPLTIGTTTTNNVAPKVGNLSEPSSPSSPGSMSSSQLDLENQTGSQRPTFKDGLKTYNPKDLIPHRKELHKFIKWREYTIIFFALTSIILGAIKLYVFRKVYNQLYGYLVFIDINVAIFFIGNVFIAIPFLYFGIITKLTKRAVKENLAVLKEHGCPDKQLTNFKKKSSS